MKSDEEFFEAVDATGGFAFHSQCPTPGGGEYFDAGLTKRDWFAWQALAAMGTWTPPFDWTQGEYGSDEWHARARVERAKYAYAQADAMLAARKP